MAEYEVAFTRLEQFAQTFDTEKQRAKRFVEGLNPTLRSRVLGYRCPTLVDAVDLAAWYEDDRKLIQEECPKGKGKMFTPQPSASRVPSSGSSGSSGKKRNEPRTRLLGKDEVFQGEGVLNTVRLARAMGQGKDLVSPVISQGI